MVSQFANNPSLGYFNAINQILLYFARSPDKSITLGRDEER